MISMKKIANSFIVSILCVSMMVSSFATGIEKETQRGQADQNIIYAIENAIKNIVFEKEKYGFTGVDLSRIQIGAMIPAYEVRNNEIVVLDTISFYPIIDRFGVIVCMTAVTHNAIDVEAYVSAEFVPALNVYQRDADIALIFDSNGVYCWNGETATLLRESEISEKLIGRSELSNVPLKEYEKIITEPIMAICEIDMTKDKPMPIGYDDEAAYVDAPIKLQPSNSLWCWAACIASVAEHEKKGTYTCTEIANRYTTNQNVAASMDEVVNILRSDFNLQYQNCTNGDTRNLLNTLGKGHLACGGFVASGSGHMVIIRGVDFGGGVFSVMDPQSSGSGYATGKISGYGKNETFTYVHFSTGVKLTLKEFAYM